MIKKNNIFVVEGKSDESKLQEFDSKIKTISVGGSAINSESINFLIKNKKRFNIIILTDPDYPGEKIRKELSKIFDSAQHIFIPKESAKKNNKVGIEFISKKTFLTALEGINFYSEFKSISKLEFNELELTGSKFNNTKRKKIAKHFAIGNPNGKTLFKRLNMIGVNKSDILRVLDVQA